MKAAKAKKSAQQKKPEEKVLAHTKNGVVHQITDFKPTKKTEEEDTKLVENNVKQTGSSYIEAQQNLPDVVPVGGNPNEAPPEPTGKGEP